MAVKKTKTTKKFTKNTKFADIMRDNPDTAEVMAGRGMFCGGCPLASEETIEQGAEAHGINADELVEELNKKKKI